jgi:hypothetical protein
MFLISKPIFPRIAVVNGLQCVAHVVFVLHFVRMCVAKGERFDQILNLWQQRCSLELEALDFGGIHGHVSVVIYTCCIDHSSKKANQF